MHKATIWTQDTDFRGLRDVKYKEEQQADIAHGEDLSEKGAEKAL